MIESTYQAVRNTRGELPVMLKLDGGKSLMCGVEVVGEVVRCLAREVGVVLGGKR